MVRRCSRACRKESCKLMSLVRIFSKSMTTGSISGNPIGFLVGFGLKPVLGVITGIVVHVVSVADDAVVGTAMHVVDGTVVSTAANTVLDVESVTVVVAVALDSIVVVVLVVPFDSISCSFARPVL